VTVNSYEARINILSPAPRTLAPKERQRYNTVEPNPTVRDKWLLAKVIVIYDTKYGNTKLVAEKITEGLREVKGIETTIRDVRDIDIKEADGFDAVLIGAPNHMGSPSRTIMGFIDKLGKLSAKTRWAAVFDTYIGKDFEKAVKKMEKRISEKAPALKLIAPGLSIRVEGMKGPIAEGELPKCRAFGRKIADQLKA